MKNNVIIIGIILIVGCAGFFSGKYFGKAKRNYLIEDDTEKTLEVRLGGYKFINPLLECDNYVSSDMLLATELEEKIKEFIKKAETFGRATDISFYCRDLANGPWIGVREKEKFSPASLLKVPILTAAFKMDENEPGFIKKKVRYDKKLNPGEVPNIIDSVIKIGNEYTIEKLINNMIVYSDNEARLLLVQNIDPAIISKVYSDLGIDVTNVTDDQDFMSARTFSSFFRILYNATYLNKDNSEKALQILSHTNFHQGIPALLPDSIVVAHKFGERGYPNSDIKELHDCGIVYKGKTPYLICVMTKGTNIQELRKIIGEISFLVYQSY